MNVCKYLSFKIKFYNLSFFHCCTKYYIYTLLGFREKFYLVTISNGY